MKRSNGDQSMAPSSKHPNIFSSTSRETTYIEPPRMSQWEVSQSNHHTKHDICASSIKNSTTNRTSNTLPKRAPNLLSQSLEWQQARGVHTIDMHANYLLLLLHQEWTMQRQSGTDLRSTGNCMPPRSSVN